LQRVDAPLLHNVLVRKVGCDVLYFLAVVHVTHEVECSFCGFSSR
jgi:hypothetical protein